MIVAAYLFISAYQDYGVLRKKAEILGRQMKLLEFQEAEFARQKKVVARVTGFLGRAKAVGLTRDKWAYYPVRKQEPAAFADVAAILNQSVNTDSYYFKPVQLHLMVRDKNRDKEKPPPAGEEGGDTVPAGDDTTALNDHTLSLPFDFPGESNADLMMSLKGSFLVRGRQ